MRIGIVGYGKMGKRITELAEQLGHSVPVKIDSKNKAELNKLKGIDVAIEFTNPEVAISNFELLAEQRIPTVTGSTGWHDQLDYVKRLFAKTNTPFFYASNFSIGVHITNGVAAYLTKLISNYPDYNGEIEEWHHTAKLDAPSGTAITLAKTVIENQDRYQGHVCNSKNTPDNMLPIKAYREGNIPGTHIIRFESEIDTISLKHEAKNRDGFAMGAIKAATFLVEQSHGTFTMNDLIKL
jgi:4-hydroxy-tetrahydrodipicolinate reductase